MRTYPNVIAKDVSVWANNGSSGYFASSAFKIEYTIGFSVQAVTTGTNPLGILTLHGSLDGTHFTPIRNSAVALSDGSSATTIWNTQFSNYEYLMLTFQATSATSGILNAMYFSKGA